MKMKNTGTCPECGWQEPGHNTNCMRVGSEQTDYLLAEWVRLLNILNLNDDESIRLRRVVHELKNRIGLTTARKCIRRINGKREINWEKTFKLVKESR